MWINKKMDSSTVSLNGKTINIWSVVEKFQVGHWEWGVTADLNTHDKSNIWIIENLPVKTNRLVSLDSVGNIKGQTKIRIPLKNLDSDFIKGYPPLPTQRVRTTISKQLAMYVIIHSPLQMASDFIENYKNHPALDFIKSVPVSWDTTIVLNGEIEKYLTMARKDRNSNDWFIGSISDDSSRNFNLPLSFLKEGDYQALIYSDKENTDLENRPGVYNKSRTNYTSQDTINIKLSAGGGQAIQLKYMD